MEVEDGFGAEDLFDDDRRQSDDEENRGTNLIDEAIEVPEKSSKAKADEEKSKKRIIRNPQPKLDPARILGPRGISTLPQVFSDFKAKGGDHVFEDLDMYMKKMEHWAHRLYPKLPCDDVMDRIAVLGKKMSIQTNVKKIRMGMDPLIQQEVPNEEEIEENQEDNTHRYDNEEFPTEDVFEEMMREADEANREPPKEAPKPSQGLTEEQKERMMRNRRLAEERRLARQQEKLKLEAAALSQYEDDEQITIIGHNEDDSDVEQPLSQVYTSNRKNLPEPGQNEDSS